MRYELTDHEWIATKSMLPNKLRGVPRVDDRRILVNLEQLNSLYSKGPA
jgi:hypothetical protein